MIESINNQKIKELIKLKEKKERDNRNCFLIEGDHLLEEALKENLVCEIYATNEQYQTANIPFYLVSEAVMKKISSQVSSSQVVAVCKKMEEKEIKGNVCILDGIQDPGNLGTIIRSAVAFNIHTIILSKQCVDLYNEKVLRSTEGMIFHLNFMRVDLKEKIEELKQKGYSIFGTDVREGKPLKELDFSGKNAIIIGNEGNGMNHDLYPSCDQFIHIPILCESLNAGVAASIIFYEMKR